MKNLKSKWMYVPIITGVLVLGSIAIVAGANGNSAKEHVENQQKDMLTNEEISKKAVAVVDGTVTKVEMEQKLRGTIYEVEVHKDGIEYDLDMDAFTGEVLKNEQSKDDDDDDDDFNQSDLSNGTTDSTTFKVSMDEAIKLALKEVTGTINEVELESEHSKLFYKMEIEDGSKEVDVFVDTESGKVFVEKDDDSDDDDDNDDD